MRVLLLGAAGLIGRHLRSALAGRDVLACTRDGRDGTVAVDVRDADRLRAVVLDARADTIIDAAAEAWVERCEREPRETRAVNVEPVRALASLAAVRPAILVVFSSEYVFDGARGSYSEEDPTSPINEYGRQKVEIERLARCAPDHLIIRSSGVYGIEPARKNFVWQVVDRLRTGQPFRVADDQLITPTFAPSLAAALVELLDAGARGILHVPGPQVMRRDAFARLAADAFRLPLNLIVSTPTADLGLTAPRPPRAGLSDARLRKVLGRPSASPEDGLRALAAELDR